MLASRPRLRQKGANDPICTWPQQISRNATACVSACLPAWVRLTLELTPEVRAKRPCTHRSRTSSHSALACNSGHRPKRAPHRWPFIPPLRCICMLGWLGSVSCHHLPVGFGTPSDSGSGKLAIMHRDPFGAVLCDMRYAVRGAHSVESAGHQLPCV